MYKKFKHNKTIGFKSLHPNQNNRLIFNVLTNLKLIKVYKIFKQQILHTLLTIKIL